MQYTEEVDKERKIVIARVSGGMTKEKIAPETTQTRVRAKELNYSILFDFRKVHNYLTIVDAYYWLAEHYDDVDPTLKFVPTASPPWSEGRCDSSHSIAALSSVSTRMFAPRFRKVVSTKRENSSSFVSTT